MVSLDLFGVVHADRFGVVNGELTSRVRETGADAVFVERPTDPISLREWLVAVFRLPLVVVGFTLYTAVSYPMLAVLTRTPYPAEIRAVERLTDEAGAPVHAVDPHTSVIFDAGGWPAVAANWLALAAAVVVSSPSSVAATVTAVPAAVAAVTFLSRVSTTAAAVLGAVAFLPLFVVLAAFGSTVALVVLAAATLWAVWTTTEERNEVMVDRIRETAADEGYDRAVFVTGRVHVSGTRELVGDTAGLAVATVWLRRPLRSGRLVDDD